MIKRQLENDEHKQDSFIEHEEAVKNNPFNQMQTVFEPSQLTPLINDKCESLKIVFGAMRDILNSLRPHQAKQSIIQALQKQLAYKQNKLKQIKKNTQNGQKFVDQKLNIKKDEQDEQDQQNEFPFYVSTTDNNHTQESIRRLKQTLDESFFE